MTYDLKDFASAIKILVSGEIFFKFDNAMLVKYADISIPSTFLNPKFDNNFIIKPLELPKSNIESFGVILMRSPGLVADCVKAMLDASKNIDITVKCRIGVDEDNPYLVLPEFIEMLQLAGINRLIIHARKAWLKGISPKQNRDLPPLDYNLIFKMKKIFPKMHLTLNGGVQNITQVKGHLDNGIDGVMIGRSAYYNPVQVLQNIDGEIYQKGIVKNGFEVVEEMLPYIEKHLQNGGRLNQITRHMLGIFSGQPGAKLWRRNISEQAHKKGADLNVLINAVNAVALTNKNNDYLLAI